MRPFLVGWLAAIAGMIVADALFTGLTLPPSETNRFWATLAGFSAAFAFLTMIVRPLVFKLLGPLGCLLTAATFGFIQVLGASGLFWVVLQLPLEISVDGPFTGLLTVLVISAVTFTSSMLLGARRSSRRR